MAVPSSSSTVTVSVRVRTSRLGATRDTCAAQRKVFPANWTVTLAAVGAPANKPGTRAASASRTATSSSIRSWVKISAIDCPLLTTVPISTDFESTAPSKGATTNLRSSATSADFFPAFKLFRLASSSACLLRTWSNTAWLAISLALRDSVRCSKIELRSKRACVPSIFAIVCVKLARSALSSSLTKISPCLKIPRSVIAGCRPIT